MPTEFNDALHYGLFLTNPNKLDSSTVMRVRQSELTLAGLRAAGVLGNMVDGLTAPATDKLWLDKNSDPAVLKEWDPIGSAWAPFTFERMFERAAATPMTVTGGTANAITVSQPSTFISSRLYSITPTATNTGAVTVDVAGVGTFDVTYLDGGAVLADELAVGRPSLLIFRNGRLELLFGYRAQVRADEAADRAEAAAAGVNLPPVTSADAGKGLSVKADGSGFELRRIPALVLTIAELKALDTGAVTSASLEDVHRKGHWDWRSGDFAARIASDPFEAVYLKADAVAATSGAWVRRMKDGFFHMDWAGARTAADIKPIFDSMKLLAAGATLCFGAATYVTSDTLAYEAEDNKGVWITGVSETETIIQNEGTGFTFEYYGITGSANEVRGGGVFRMKLEKSGAGICSGVDIANAYRGRVAHVDASACGNIGLRITGRGEGDQDATAGFVIEQNRFKGGEIGIQIKGDSAGAIVAAEILIQDNNLDGNAKTNLWLASCDKVEWYRNIMVAGGHGAEQSRGCFYVEYHGMTCKNLKSGFNEYGNSFGAGAYIGIVDAVQGFTLESDRWIRNNADVAVAGVIFGFTNQPATIGGVRFEKPFINAGSDGDDFTFLLFGAGTQTYTSLIVVEDPVLNEWNSADHLLSGDTTKTVVTRYGKDIRDTNARVADSGSGAINISTNVALYHAIDNIAGTATTLTVTGEKHEGDILTVEVTHSGAGTLALTLGSGFTGASASIGSTARQSVQFRYSAQAGTWRQTSPWTTM